jgi:hypothetical protein
MIEQEFTRKQRALQERIGARNAIKARLDEHEAEVVLLSERMANTEKAVYLLQKYSEDQQAMLAERIEGTVTAGLRAVFQNPSLSFKLHYSETKKGTVKKAPEVTMSVVYKNADGNEVSGDLKSSFGGGLAVVTAALLNVIVVLQMAPRVAPILLWDEQLMDLSPDYGTGDVASRYREAMADFLATLKEETPIQIIMVSHEDEYGRVADYHHRFTGGIGQIATTRTT